MRRYTSERMLAVYNYAKQFYEPENAAKCWRQVWRFHVMKIYPMSYDAFMNYVAYGKKYYNQEKKEEQLTLWG